MVIFARELVHKYRVGMRGMLLAHVYDVGVVFERTLGSLFTVPLTRQKFNMSLGTTARMSVTGNNFG